MTDFSDIDRAYDAFDRTGSWGSVDRGLIYTCNGGWIDFGHMSTTNNRPNIGASNLWNQVTRESGPAFAPRECSWASADLNIGYEYVRRAWHGCHEDNLYHFPDNSTGFLVRYRQDHEEKPGNPGAGGTFVVKHNMTEGQQKSVALSIYADVTHRFETFQLRAEQLSNLIGDPITNSGFSQEDLVSNLIGFYIAIGDVTKTEAMTMLHPVSRETAKAVWARSGAVGDNKNREWSPVIHETYTDDEARQMCQDDCIAQPRRLPDKFRRVRPTQPGALFEKLSNDWWFNMD